MNDITELVNLMRTLVDRLAPVKQQSTPIRFDGITTVPGYLLPAVKMTNPYNQIVVSLSQGTVYVYRNFFDPTGTTSQVPDFVINPTDNPLPIPMGLLNDTQLFFKVAPTSPLPAKGFIYINRY